MRAIKYVSITLTALVAIVLVAVQFAAPVLVRHEVRSRLAAAGYRDAHFRVGTIGTDRVELLDVELLRGVALGDVTISSREIVLQHPRVDADVALALPHSGKPPAFDRITVEDGIVTRGADRLEVRGTIDLAKKAYDLRAQAPRLRLGDLVLEDVAAKVHGHQACATGTVKGARVDACYALDTKLLVWNAHAVDGQWSARGEGHVDGTSLDGHVDVKTPMLDVHADVAGSPASFTLRGEAVADEVAVRNATVRGASLVFALAGKVADGHVALVSAHPLEAAATSVTIADVRVDAPIVTAKGHLAFGPLTLDAGGHDAFEIVAKIHDVPVDRVLAAATRKRVRATGVLDGSLVFDDRGTLVGGGLAAREPGTLAVAELAAVKPDAPHKRIAAALADFQYTRLALTVANDPEMKLKLQGRGRRVAQELDIDVNVRGLLERKR